MDFSTVSCPREVREKKIRPANTKTSPRARLEPRGARRQVEASLDLYRGRRARRTKPDVVGDRIAGCRLKGEGSRSFSGVRNHEKQNASRFFRLLPSAPLRLCVSLHNRPAFQPHVAKFGVYTYVQKAAIVLRRRCIPATAL